MIRHNKEKLFKCNQSDKTFSLNTNQGSYQSTHWEDASVVLLYPENHLHEGVMGGRVYLNTRSPLFEHSAPPVVRNIIFERSHFRSALPRAPLSF